jgi:GT2 family glycosyltransferase
MRTSAIIVTYNKKEMLKKSLDALLNLNNDLYKVVVINNNSSDGTDKYLESINDERVLYKNLTENLGGAGGFNRGLEVAYDETDADYFWIMDDDAIAQPDALDKLLSAAERLHNHFGFLSSSVCYENGEGANCPFVNDDWNRYLVTHNLIRLKEASFVSLFIRKQVLEKVGLPISEMFIWGDDLEYTTRIGKKINYDNFFVPDSLITHFSKHVGTTIYNCPEKLLPRYKLMYRNLLFTTKHYDSKLEYFKRIIHFIFLSFRALFKSDDLKYKRFKAVFMGYMSGILFNPRIKFVNKNTNK